MKTIAHSRVLDLLDYSKDTGIFVWKKTTSNRVSVGSVAGTQNGRGYLKISIDGYKYYAHRLAWFYVNGEWPKEEIDHIDGCRSNNMIGNLRDVPKHENMQNLKSARRDNLTSGLLGVTWSRARGKWVSRIINAGVISNLGYFPDKESAYAAYLDTKRRIHHGCTI